MTFFFVEVIRTLRLYWKNEWHFHDAVKERNSRHENLTASAQPQSYYHHPIPPPSLRSTTVRLRRCAMPPIRARHALHIRILCNGLYQYSLFITVHLFRLDSSWLIAAFTVISPTPHASAVWFTNFMHSRDKAYVTNSKAWLTLIGLAFTTWQSTLRRN